MKLLDLPFRIVASGVIAIGIGALLRLLCMPAFLFVYLVPGMFIGLPLLVLLDWLFGTNETLYANGIDGPLAGLLVSALCAFLSWWAIAFAAWNYARRRPEKRYVIAVGAIALVLLVPAGWLFYFLESRWLYYLFDGVRPNDGNFFVIGGMVSFMSWMAAVIGVWTFLRGRSQRTSELSSASDAAA